MIGKSDYSKVCINTVPSQNVQNQKKLEIIKKKLSCNFTEF